jgi:hypothetical protein
MKTLITSFKILCHSKVQEIKLISTNFRKIIRYLRHTEVNPSFRVTAACTFIRAEVVISILKQEEQAVYELY